MLNVLLVDDEFHIRLGLIAKVDWSSLGMQIVAEASDGAEAIEMLGKHNIDIIITDIMMPIMNGMQLIETVDKLNIHTKCIVISGFSEFEYARAAMKYGVTEYILKPIKENEINEALLNIKEEVETSKLLMMHSNEQKEEKKVSGLLEWLTEQNSYHLHQDVEREWTNTLVKYTVSVMKVETLTYGEQMVSQFYMHMIYEDLKNELAKYKEAVGHCYIFRNKKVTHDFILLIDVSQPFRKDKVITRLKLVLEELEIKYKLCISIGIGNYYKNFEEMKHSYQHAVFALKERLLVGTGKIIEFNKLVPRADKNNTKIETRPLLHLLKEKKFEKAKDYIEYIFKNSAETHNFNNHVEMHELFFEVYFLIKQFLQEEDSALLDAIEIRANTNIADIVVQFNHVDQMVDWLYQYLETSIGQSGDEKDTTGKEIVFRVQAYIKDFCSSDINLNMVAEKYHINPIYFSRIFKTYTGESFNHYITRVRMEEAKKLIETTALKQQDISEIVGYEDAKYFSKVFKKYFGISPSQYAEQVRKVESE